MAKTSFIDMLKIFGDILDGSSDWLKIFGISFKKKKGTDGKKDTYEVKNLPSINGEVEEILQAVDNGNSAKNIFTWIDMASKGQFQITEGGKTINIDDNVIMIILAEISPKNRLAIYEIYNNGTKEEFQQAMARLLNEPTKRMRLIKVWIKKIMPILKKGGKWLMNIESPELQKITNQMNQKATDLHKKRKNGNGNWFTRMYTL